MTTPEEMGRILDAMPELQRAYVILAGKLNLLSMILLGEAKSGDLDECEATMQTILDCLTKFEA